MATPIPDTPALETLDDLVHADVLSPGAALFLTNAVLARFNILILGTAGSGKTTLLRALARAGIASTDEPAIVDEVDELQLLASFPQSVPFTDVNQLMTGQHPDRIIVGELVGRDALHVLEDALVGRAAWLATMSTRRIESLVPRLEWLTREEGVTAAPGQIADAVRNGWDLLIELGRNAATGQRYITRVVEPVPGRDWRVLFHRSGGLFIELERLSDHRQQRMDEAGTRMIFFEATTDSWGLWNLFPATFDDVDATIEGLASLYADEDLGTEARALLRHVCITVIAASTADDPPVFARAYALLTKAPTALRVLARAMASGRLPADTLAFWAQQEATDPRGFFKPEWEQAVVVAGAKIEETPVAGG